ncbi:hypothetical protein [Neobacillus vireti]|uniref:hypothetical protein n=1 Tax=Neobacillus vireti TaxID=220686 RepID=UPI002FFD64B4
MKSISNSIDVLKHYSNELMFEKETNLPYSLERLIGVHKIKIEDIEKVNLFEKIKIKGLERLIPKNRIIVGKGKLKDYLLPLINPGTLFKVDNSYLVFDDLYKNNKLKIDTETILKDNERLLLLNIHLGLDHTLIFLKLSENELINYKNINLISIKDIENKVKNYNSLVEDSEKIFKNEFKNTFLYIYKTYLKVIKTNDLVKFDRNAREMERTKTNEIRDLRFIVSSDEALKTCYATDLFPALNIESLQLFLQKACEIEGIILVDPILINYFINNIGESQQVNIADNQRDLLGEISNLLGCYKTISFNDLNLFREEFNDYLPIYEGNWIFICPENIEKLLKLLSNKKELYQVQEPYSLLALDIFDDVETDLNKQRNIMYKFVLNHEIGHSIYKNIYNYKVNQFEIINKNIKIDKESLADIFSCFLLQPEEIFFIDLIKQFIVERIDIRMLANEVVKNRQNVVNQFSAEELEKGEKK